ncbi:MAG: amidohydrolase family protein [Lentisphaeria bacterium]|nr:amidohydrolase family protein [Lentisphaeria bacterium]
MLKMFDVNTAIGHWPFRRLTRNTLPELKDHLQSFGITHAAVTHNHAACYQNCHDANIELFEALSNDKSGFFVGIATINPTYAAWQRDLECCVKKFDFRGVRILPKYHNYRINSRDCWELCDEAAKYQLPVIIPNELVNCRQRFWMEPDEALGAGSIEMTARRFPDTTFIGMETAFPENSNPPKNLYVEMSRFLSCYGRKLNKYIASAGADHVLFGSGVPFKEIEPALLKLHHTELSEADRELISHKNAEKLFKLQS